jgi:hypothetical protein
MINWSQPKYLYGAIAIAVIALAFIIAGCWGVCKKSLPKSKKSSKKTNVASKLKNHIERFRDYPNPLIYTKQLFSFPSYCRPYAGCNAQQDTKNQNLTWCELAWRDCNAYEDCIQGKCQAKQGL